MGAQADGLLVDGDLIGKDGGLGQNAGLVDGGRLQDLLHLGGQARAVLRNGLRRALLDHAGDVLDGIEPAADVGGKALALGRAHPIVRGKRVIEHGAEVGGDALQVLLRLGDGQDVGKAGDGRRGDLVSARPQASLISHSAL